MSIIKSNKKWLTTTFLACSFPIIVLTMQILSPNTVLIAGLILLVSAVVFPTQRTILLIFSFVVLGYLFWLYASEYIWSSSNLSPLLTKAVSRFGLIGYLFLFAVWHWLLTPKNRFLKCGDGKAVIRFPFIWKGIKEIEWRFTLIFSLICSGVACYFAFTTELSFPTILYGILFSLINAILEELLWRGLILTRLLDISSEKIALIVSSLAFGLYHYSLQFPIWACLVFAIGGFYMGGSAIKSKGLLSPVIMHVMVNIVFVFGGIIS